MRTADLFKRLEWLQTPTLLRPYAFDRVTVCGRLAGETGSRPLFSIVGKCYSEYPSGPSFFEVVDAAGELLGEGWYGLESCRALGYRCESEVRQ